MRGILDLAQLAQDHIFGGRCLGHFSGGQHLPGRTGREGQSINDGNIGLFNQAGPLNGGIVCAA